MKVADNVAERARYLMFVMSWSHLQPILAVADLTSTVTNVISEPLNLAAALLKEARTAPKMTLHELTLGRQTVRGVGTGDGGLWAAWRSIMKRRLGEINDDEVTNLRARRGPHMDK